MPSERENTEIASIRIGYLFLFEWGVDLADHALYDHLREIDEFLEPDQPSR